MQRNWLHLLLLTGFLFWLFPVNYPPLVFAQTQEQLEEKAIKAEKERQKFLTEMRTLMDATQQSGFTEKEIREIKVTRNGKEIHVWDFLEQEKIREKKAALAKKKSKPKDRYLTVMDISEELESKETRQLDLLKSESTFVGAEEK